MTPRPSLLSVVCAWSLSLLGVPAAFGESAVWKVQAKDRTIYLGGTFHILRATDFPLPAEFDEAFAVADALWFETHIGEMIDPQVIARMLARGVYRDGRTLESVLAPEVWRAVEEYCGQAGLTAASIARMKPGIFMVMIGGLEAQKAGASELGVDVHYFHRAEAAGKPVHGLETFKQHLGFLEMEGDGIEDEFVLSAIDGLAEARETLDRMIGIWRSGDLAALENEIFSEMRTKYPALYRTLIAARNANWLPQIEAMFESEPIELVLVGAGHLPGPDGLLTALRQRGYTVEQLGVGAAKGSGEPEKRSAPRRPHRYRRW